MNVAGSVGGVVLRFDAGTVAITTNDPVPVALILLKVSAKEKGPSCRIFF